MAPHHDERIVLDTAAHLVLRVLSGGATYRQWLLSLLRWVRFRLACQLKLVASVFVNRFGAFTQRVDRNSIGTARAVVITAARAEHEQRCARRNDYSSYVDEARPNWPSLW